MLVGPVVEKPQHVIGVARWQKGFLFLEVSDGLPCFGDRHHRRLLLGRVGLTGD
jgi:hypothetical protein